jgi:OmpA-OmpF porin, OOP family
LKGQNNIYFCPLSIKSNQMNRTLQIITSLCLLTIFSVFNVNAQSEDKRIGIEINGGFMEYKGDLGSALFFAREPIYNGMGGNIGYYISPSFDAMFMINSGDVGFSKWFWDNSINDYFKHSFTARLLNASAGIRYKFNNGVIMSEDAKIFPYIPLAWGYQNVHSRINRWGVENRNKNYTGHSGVLHFGLGLQFNVNDMVSLRLQSMFNYTFNDVWDGAPFTFGPHKVKQQEDMYAYHSLGVVVNLGPSGPSTPKTPKPLKDTDNDGVPDKYDLCPNTPEGVEVDSVGCPLDTDGDKIPDYKDSCVNEPGLPEFDGCPDRDGDGVPDRLDKCPDEPGLIENYGCPELTEDEKQEIDLAAKGVYFELNSATLSPECYNKLDRLITILNNHPEIKLIIEGHTDSTGNAQANKKLSQDRVSSVKEYLVSQGIPRDRLTPIGYGEEKPLYDNATEEGRRKNRRVYFQVVYE